MAPIDVLIGGQPYRIVYERAARAARMYPFTDAVFEDNPQCVAECAQQGVIADTTLALNLRISTALDLTTQMKVACELLRVWHEANT